VCLFVINDWVNLKAQRWCSLQLHNVRTKVGENLSSLFKSWNEGTRRM